MKRLFSFLIIILLTLQGCGEKTNPRYTLSDAEKKFLDICRKENKLPVQLFEMDNTIWIYLPMEEDLILNHGAKRSDESKSGKKFVVNTFEGERVESAYHFVLDITDGIKTAKDPGYKSDATEAFMKNRMTIYGAIGQSFFDLNELPGDRKFADPARDKIRQDMLEKHIPKAKVPEFFVVVIADIKKGLAYKTVFNLDDHIKYRSEVLPYEEYRLREISELYGDEKLVGDKTGKSLKPTAITWPFFLIEQIKNRINFRFLSSDFPPKDIIIEISGNIANTFRTYEYKDFSMIILKDIREDKSYQYDPEQLATFNETVGMHTDRARSFRVRSPGFR